MEGRKSPIRISFKKHEKNIEDYIRTKGDMSVYLKDLVKEDMKKNERQK